MARLPDHSQRAIEKRRRMQRISTLVATCALVVLGLAGTAAPASPPRHVIRGTKRVSAKVLKQLRGKSGSKAGPGPQGRAGTNGPGPSGAVGPQGLPGIP